MSAADFTRELPPITEKPGVVWANMTSMIPYLVIASFVVYDMLKQGFHPVPLIVGGISFVILATIIFMLRDTPMWSYVCRKPDNRSK